MYRKILWFYIFVLTLLDISLKTKLSAHGKSHGVTVHDSLMEGITFQEWGKEPESGGRRVASDALLLSPPALEFGRAALAAAHTLTVTLTNTANTTMHLASVAGTTPDFHASFFHSKTLPPQANTTFSVVYLGRREGHVAAHLYIHTSLGVHKYPVSAVGVASEWGVWPLVGLRVPLNSTAEPLLTMYNPTDHTIQVSEVYSSGSWLGLRLPGGGAAAPRDLWALPPRAERPLVRLRLSPPHDAAHALTAYIRIKANVTGGGLVVCVEARGAPPGEFLSPWHVRLRARGSDDPPLRMVVEAGNSAGSGVALDASVWARCAADPPAPAPPAAPGAANGNGAAPEGGGGGVSVSLLRTHLEPHQGLARAARLTLDYAKMWAEREAGADGAWCAGWVRVGRAHLPYSVRLLPGTVRLLPADLHVVSVHREEALKVREVRVRNEFKVPVHITHVELAPDIDEHFESEWAAPLTLGAGAEAVLGRLWLRAAPRGLALHTRVVLHTNLTSYELPVLVYDARLDLEWEWPNSADGELRLGGVGASSTRHVALRVHNTAPAPLCVDELRAELAGAQLTLEACAHLRHVPADHACRCVAAGGSAQAWLTVVAPAREGPLSGAVWTRTRAPHAPPHAAQAQPVRTPVSLHVLRGRLHALPLLMPRVAPYAWSSAPLVLESTMAVRMRVVNVSLAAPDPALIYVPAGAGGAEVSAGRQAVGTVVYAAERLCEPHCYTGLDLDTPEGVSWVRRAAEVSPGALRADAALHAERYAQFTRHARRAANISLHVHTTQVVQVGARGVADWWWVRLAAGGGDAGLCAVGAGRALRLRAANPASAHTLLLQPVVAAYALHLAGAERAERCAARERCVWSAESFRVAEWRATRGAVRQWEGARANASAAEAPVLLLGPGAELEMKLVFAPKDALPLTAYLYLRNNLTIIEGIQLFGRGAHPSFEIAGRRPNTNSPLLFEVEGCAADGDGTVRRTVVARNTGAVGVRLREWRVAGQPCQARGFRVRPCAPLHLAPNESRALTLAFAPDYTLARAAAPLHLLTESGAAVFRLRAAAPVRLLPRCASAQPRPPWEPALRAAGTILALAALALVLAAATLDAERELRRSRARPPPAARQPLDLRALARVPPVPPAPPRRVAPRRRRATRRVLPALDPHAERHAFERWRARAMRPEDDDDSRSSEDADRDTPAALAASARADNDPEVEASPLNATVASAAAELPLAVDGYEADRETEDRPPGGGEDDAASTGSGTASASSSSSPTVDRDEAEPDVDEHEPDHGAETSPDNDNDNDAPSESAHRREIVLPVADGAVRAPRPRRDTGDTPRRGERARPEAGEGARGARSTPAKHHTRKDKVSKRRTERPPASPTRSPAHAACPAPEAGGAIVRWGASWSSVVAARGGPGALAPIGSNVRRRAEPGPRADHSLFYFNGDATQVSAPAPDYWCAPAPLEPPAFTPARDYTATEEPSGGATYRPLGSVWGEPPANPGADAAWRWGDAGEVRPPPGFGGARPARVYDPFRSLAAIWAPGARDWRADPPPRAADE